MEEIWKDIINYEGYYAVSNLGSIKNVQTNKLLKGDTNRLGYKRVVLYSPIQKRFFVHRLVALHFVQGFNENLVVNHKDGNKQNNVYTNLEWVTRSDNDKHAFKLGLRKAHPCYYKKRIGAFNMKGDLVRTFNNSEECSIFLKVCRSNIYSCCNGHQMTCKGYVLKYI